MKYFSGSAVQRLPLYKLALGCVAMLLCASIGVSVMASAFINAPARQARPEPEVQPIATQETATPSPTPSPTPAPAVNVYGEVSVVQQDIGVQLYRMVDTEPDGDAKDTTTAQTVNVAAADTAALDAADGKLPLTGVEMDITITLVDEDGAAKADAEPIVCPVDTDSGTVLAEDVEPGDYTVSYPQVEGYNMPAPVTVTVNEKVEYHADVEAVKDKIVQANEVVESQEDSSYGGGSVVADEITDTVAYAEPKQEEIGRTTVYTVQLSGDYLVLKDGTVTAYKPVYNENGELTGAQRDGSARTLAAGSTLGVGLAGLLRHGSNAPAVPADSGVNLLNEEDATETTPPEETPAQDPSASPSASPTPAMTPTPSAAPTQEPTPDPTPTPTPEPTPAPPPPPPPTPPPAPTPPPTPSDPTAGWPDSIGAKELESYGFAVTSEEKITYQYTGWQNIDGKNYYYDPATHQPVTGTQVIQGNVYTFAADGALNQTARGIDVSKYQGNIDWNAVAADGITFAIIRVGYRGYGSGALVEDSTFRKNIQGATAAGLRVGVYFYSQAVNEAEAVEEASMVLSLCQGYGLPLGVYYDTEKVAGDTGRADGISAAQRTANAVAFCETIRNAGYAAGVYSYASWFYNSLNFANISKYRIWIAQYRDTLDFNYHYDIWQYTSTGKVNGVSGGVDMNIG